MRKIVTDWMLEVCEDQESRPEVFLLAVHYLDRFLSSTTITKTQFQLVAATCLLLASKFSAVVPISALQLVLYTDHSVTVEELREWELRVLAVIQWELSAPTSHSFLEQLLARLECLAILSTAQLSKLRRHAETLTALCATEYSLLLARQSVLAGAALTAAYPGLRLPSSTLVVERVATCLSRTEQELLHYTSHLDALIDSSRPVKASSPAPQNTSSTLSCSGSQSSSRGSITPTDCYLKVV